MDYQTHFRFDKKIEFKIEPYEILFKKPAKTSRDTLVKRQIFFLKVRFVDNPNVFGVGECSPIYGLSPEREDEIIDLIHAEIDRILSNDELNTLHIKSPAIRFAFEMACNDLFHGGKRLYFGSQPSAQKIPINGLVWMNEADAMLKESIYKAQSGFDTIKFKVGALNFEDEIRVLHDFRNQFPANRMIIRLDANGAFSSDEVLMKLNALKKYDIHSIEQPTSPLNDDVMKMVIDEDIIPVALDEHLIGKEEHEMFNLLHALKPHYIVLKPMLHGGISGCTSWINHANSCNVGWWITSMLESSIGLNAIAQWVQRMRVQTPQGLGTGGLYENNFSPAWEVQSGFLSFHSLSKLQEETSKW